MDCNNTGDSVVLALAKRWLDICLDTHDQCRFTSPLEGHFVPSRLIHITSRDNQVVSARPVYKDKIEANIFYTNLSYCWGESNPCRLMEASVENFRQQIPTQLPKILAETQHITVQLGYEYIWIDSLCIIQDLKEDWDREASTMGSVYRHSVCTITAAGSKSGDGGFFYERQSLATIPAQISRSFVDSQGRSRSGFYTQANYHDKPLHTRA